MYFDRDCWFYSLSYFYFVEKKPVWNLNFFKYFNQEIIKK